MVMPQNWKTYSLDEVCTKIYSGGTPKTSNSEYWNGNIPWLSSGETRNRIIDRTEKKITPNGLKNSSAKMAYHGDTVIASAGQGKTRGQTSFLVINTSINQSVICLAPNREIVDDRYLFYDLSGRYVEFRQISDSFSTRGSLTTDLLKTQIKLTLPPLPIQRRIASILGALDDKIELNLEMNKTLEEMAMALYKHWFVDFGPFKHTPNPSQEGNNSVGDSEEGHEKTDQSPSTTTKSPLEGGARRAGGVEAKDDHTPVFGTGKFVESELGMIPEGWEVDNFDKLMVLQRGFDLPKTKRTDGPYPVFAASGRSNNHNKKKVNAPGVVTGRSGVIGNVYFIHEDFWPLNTTLWIKEYPNSSPFHAYFALQLLDLKEFNSGSAVPTLNRNDIHRLLEIKPPKLIIDQFDKIVKPLFQLQHRNYCENLEIKHIRDTLLPKLISGEVEVKAVEEEVSEGGLNRDLP